MRKVVHISDVHFGRTDPLVVARLGEKIHELTPDVLVVSGDLTQRARSSEFADAKAFLDKFEMPKVVVPGNHDVPLYNLFERFVRPFRKYEKYFAAEREPFFVDDELAVIGVNTARAFTIKDGRVNERQIEHIREKMCDLGESIFKVVVTHHPFDLPREHSEDDLVGRAKKMMPRLAECGADVFLAGHLHVSSITNSAHRYRLDSGQSALVIQAGTSASTRSRGEPNSFNYLEFEYPGLSVNRFEANAGSAGFVLATTEQFTKTGRGWSEM